ncbi:MAG: M20/M25/M40 family metallo-hydrolase [Ginsengibacter sp.]
MKKFFFLLLLSSTGSQINAQTLSEQEQQLVTYINNEIPNNLVLLKKLVDINSGTLNIAGVKKVGNILGKEFTKIGFTTEWIKLPDSLKRAGHLVAYKKGKKGKKVFLIGHLDTVFELDMPGNPYRKINDSTVTGQGVEDMKGGDVIILAALNALEHFGLLKDVTITAYFTGDEEKGGNPRSVARADFIKRATTHDIALGFEGAKGLNTVVTGRRGVSSWKLNVLGKQSHSAGIFGDSAGYGSVFETARILDSFRTGLSAEKYLSFNPGIIAGGTEIREIPGGMETVGKDNIIASTTIVDGDLRFLTETQKDTARAKMKRIVGANNLPGTSAEISFSDGIPSMEPTLGNSKLVAIISKVGIDMGIGEIKEDDPGSRGAGDISYVAKYLDCMDGLGASGKGAHAPGETMNLNQFPVLISRAAILIYRLTRE